MVKKIKFDINWLKGDIDRDGTPNIIDCEPFDSSKQDVLKRGLHIVTGGKYGQSKDDYEREKRKKYIEKHNTKIENGNQKKKKNDEKKEEEKKKEKKKSDYASSVPKMSIKKGKTLSNKNWGELFNAPQKTQSDILGFGHSGRSVDFDPIGFKIKKTKKSKKINFW